VTSVLEICQLFVVQSLSQLRTCIEIVAARFRAFFAGPRTIQGLTALQPKLQTLAADGGSQPRDAQDYADAISGAKVIVALFLAGQIDASACSAHAAQLARS